MAKKNYDELSEKILIEVGGRENIARAYHCMTRLRLDVKDKGLVNTEALEKLSGIAGCQWNGSQLQIIVGQEVDDLYVNFCKTAGIAAERKIEIQHRFNLSNIIRNFITGHSCISRCWYDQGSVNDFNFLFRGRCSLNIYYSHEYGGRLCLLFLTVLSCLVSIKAF